MIGFTPDGESEGMIRADKIRYWILNSGYDIIRYIVLDDEVKANYKHRCINFYINKFQIPSPTLRGVAKRPLILADMTFLTRLRSSEIPPLIVLAA